MALHLKVVAALLLAVPFASALAAEEPKPAQPAPPPKVEMGLMPMPLLHNWLQWSYDAGIPAKLMDAVRSCIDDNPHGGVIAHHGPDLCDVVTQAQREREAEIADLQKQIAALKAKLPEAAPPH